MIDRQVIVSGRGGGKTYKSLTWLSKGKPIDSFPGWSRVLIVPYQQDAEWAIRELHFRTEPSSRLADLIADKRIENVIVSMETARRMSGLDGSVEFAVDGTERVLENILRRSIKLFTFDGREYEEEPEPEEKPRPYMEVEPHEALTKWTF